MPSRNVRRLLAACNMLVSRYHRGYDDDSCGGSYDGGCGLCCCGCDGGFDGSYHGDLDGYGSGYRGIYIFNFRVYI